jgi:CheY-like chemotaxis protein
MPMRLFVVWKRPIPLALIVSLLAAGRLCMSLRLIYEAFLRRAHARIDVALRAVATQQPHLEIRTELPPLALAQDGPLQNAVAGREPARVAHALSEIWNTPGLPIIDADATPGQVERLLAAGASRYLTKPLDVKPLLATLDEPVIRSAPAHAEVHP